MRSLAQSVGMPNSNFVSALAGRRPFPKRAESALFAKLGLDAGGRLVPGRLRRWRVRNVTDLRTVLSHGLSPAAIYRLTLEGGRPPLHPLWLLVSARQEIFAVLDGIRDEDLPKLPPENFVDEASLQVGEWSAWEQAALPVEAVRILLNNVKVVSDRDPDWGDVIRAAEGRDVSPRDVLVWLEGRGAPGIRRQTNA
jgi:hypothetical protein